ncbi:MAG TPA: cobaltochelatase subunit CobN [Methanophagales archaeon]|nr:cobaltochelatase subunit CobN [Methanophagales archaeon]
MKKIIEWLVLVLFMAQIFTPFVVAQAQSEDNDTAAMAGNLTLPVNVSENTVVNTTDRVVKRNRITFVLGTAENLLSLFNASMDAAVNTAIEVIIYNATEAKSADFRNESVVFLASLDKETVEIINQTLNESAYVFAYNLTTVMNIVNVNDINITNYWVYGSDENIRNLIVYMSNLFYGNTADPQMLAEEDRPKAVFIIGGESYVPMFIKAGESSSLNATVYTSKRLPPELNLTTYDLIFLEMIGAGITQIEPALNETKEKGIPVMIIHPGAYDYLGTINMAEHPWVEEYWDNGGIENVRRLLTYIGVEFCGINATIEEPLSTLLEGIYHPDSEKLFENLTEYLDWYKATGKYHPYEPTIGIAFYDSHYKTGDINIENRIISKLEERGLNTIPTFLNYKNPDMINKYFIRANETIIDAIISLRCFRFYGRAPEKGISELKRLKVPVINAMIDYSMTPEEWRESKEGVAAARVPYTIAQPELDGQIESIIVGGRAIDLETEEIGFRPLEPINEQVDWLVNRTLSWTELRRMNNTEKRIAIIYYNHGGGKNNLGASYLDITPSLGNLLSAMKEEGYGVEGEIPEEKKLLDLMLHQGRNIGTWAPGELKAMVENESVILIPAAGYNGWFNALPANKRQEVIDKWGEPPGEIMVYENATGKYIVIPLVSFGNAILAPQPTRGWLQDQAVLYHSKELAPHHQYIAFYLWLKKEFGADAIIHFGRHGTQEWLPGKERGLSVMDCWPAILIQDIPIVYPYIMDGVGEGTQAKRRGNAVIVDHLIPPIVASGLYGNFSLLHEKIHAYLSANGSIKVEYRKTITELYDNLTLSEDLGVSTQDLRAKNDTEFEYFINGELHLYLHELADEFMPYGLHILGSPPVDWKLVSMVNSMLGEDFANHIAEVYPDMHVLHPAHENCTVMEELLNEVIFNDTSPEEAQEKVLGSGNISSNVTADLKIAKDYADSIDKCAIEIPRVLDGLSGRYVPPKVGNDPIRNPDALPTGNNFYSFDSRLIPTAEAWEVGKKMAESLLSQHKEVHNGSYPKKVAFVLWACEAMRHEGITESEALYLLGVKPVWKKGKVKDVELISSSELGRPRIDVLLASSGLYRDTFPNKIELLDKAVRLAAQAEDDVYPNYVKENTEAIYEWLIANGYNESEAQSLSMTRVFTSSPGNYGTGLENAISASNTWENETKLADLYISRMGYSYGVDGWGVPNADLFRQNLAEVDGAVHSRSTNIYGVLDTDDCFQHLGGLALAVRSITGENPDLYITNLRDPHDPKTETLKSFLRRELNARYFNPKWIESMMEHGYAGARYMDHKFLENLWGWDVVTPDLITEDMWNQVYDVYIQDKYDLGLNEFFDSNNPYAQQSITARMLEAIRKGYWDPPEDVKTTLAETYQKSVEEYGVTCCHHTCGNVLLQDYMQGIVSASAIEQSTEQSTYYFGGGGGSWSRKSTETEEETEKEKETEPDKGGINATETTGVSKLGEELKKPPEVTSEKRGKVMKEETQVEEASPAFPISGAPLMGLIAVIVVLVLIGIGLGYKRRRR